jgi:hypothetical protein
MGIQILPYDPCVDDSAPIAGGELSAVTARHPSDDHTLPGQRQAAEASGLASSPARQGGVMWNGKGRDGDWDDDEQLAPAGKYRTIHTP